MNKKQKIVLDWLSSSELNFIDNLIEMEGSFESVPDEVLDAYMELSDIQRIEVVKESASNLLSKATA